MENKLEHINESHLIAYINGELSADEKVLVETWIAVSNENKKQFDELEKTWILSGKISPKPVAVNTDDAWLKIKSKLSTEKNVVQKETRIFKINPWVKVAAVAILLIGVFSVYRYMNSGLEDITLTAKNEILIDTLSDGSVISLNKNSTLTYPDQFASKERRTKLNGEAFFEIKSDAERPFIIELNHQAQVTVLGTSFNIKQNETTTEVFVKTGKVEFKSNKTKIILTPGQKGILDIATGEISLAEISELDFNETYWLDQKLEFNNMKLKEVIQILSQLFDCSITLENSNAENCLLMTSFERESLSHMLQIIAESFGLEVKQNGNNYILVGNGC